MSEGKASVTPIHVKAAYCMEPEEPGHQVHMKVTGLLISVLPLDHEEAASFSLKVEWRGKDRWAVTWGPRGCLSRQGTWDYEPLPSSREDDWLEQHRFTKSEAIELAVEQAPKLRAGGWCVLEVLEEIKKQEGDPS
jgi:hypothetical protein